MKTLSKIEKVEGVYVCKEFSVWEVAKRRMVSSVHLLVSQKSNQTHINDEVKQLLRKINSKQVCIQ